MKKLLGHLPIALVEIVHYGDEYTQCPLGFMDKISVK
jgi:hypothetical protein